VSHPLNLPIACFNPNARPGPALNWARRKVGNYRLAAVSNSEPELKLRNQNEPRLTALYLLKPITSGSREGLFWSGQAHHGHRPARAINGRWGSGSQNYLGLKFSERRRIFTLALRVQPLGTTV